MAAFWSGCKRFGLIFAILLAFNALFVAHIGMRSDDTRYWLLLLMILAFMSFLYSGAYAMTVAAPSMRRPWFLLAYHVALGLALYVPGIVLREWGDNAPAALASLIGAQAGVPWLAYWLFLLPAVALSCYKQFKTAMDS